MTNYVNLPFCYLSAGLLNEHSQAFIQLLRVLISFPLQCLLVAFRITDAAVLILGY